jgi:hypothetical protein
MTNHAYIVVAVLPDAPQLHVVVAIDSEDAREIVALRSHARPGEYIAVVSVLSDDVAKRLGADLSSHGQRADFMPA